jgi:RecB family exonuclease
VRIPREPFPPLATPYTLDRALRRLLAEPRFRVFERVRRFPGFRDQLRRRIETWGAAGILPDQLDGDGGAQSQALAALYREVRAAVRFEPVPQAAPRQLSFPPAVGRFAAATRNAEANEVARLTSMLPPDDTVLVVVRAHDPYIPILTTAFARHGIGVRVLSTLPLDRIPTVRCAVDAVEAEWAEPARWEEFRHLLRLAEARPVAPAQARVTIARADGLPDQPAAHVFVVGLIEGEFPLTDDDGGLPGGAIDRALQSVTLSCSRFDDNGDERLPSAFFLSFAGPVEDAARFPPRPPVIEPPSPRGPILPDLAASFANQRVWRPTEIDTYLQCPFKYLVRYWLKIEPPAARPEERLDFREQGKLIHDVLRDARSGGEASALHERLFRLLRDRLPLPDTHQVEFLRVATRRDLDGYFEQPLTRPGTVTQTEWTFETELVEGLRLRGRIDRFDHEPDGTAHAVDYKYSAAQRVKQLARSEHSVQAGLYLIALERAGYQPVSFTYAGVKKKPQLISIVPVEPAMRQARELTIEAAAAIAAGQFPVEPAKPADCSWCEFIDACRIRERRGIAAAAGEDVSWP